MAPERVSAAAIQIESRPRVGRELALQSTTTTLSNITGAW
jgi:hypothetical protein